MGACRMTVILIAGAIGVGLTLGILWCIAGCQEDRLADTFTEGRDNREVRL